MYWSFIIAAFTLSGTFLFAVMYLAMNRDDNGTCSIVLGGGFLSALIAASHWLPGSW